MTHTKNKKKYTLRQRFAAAMVNQNVEWYCATKIERMKMTYDSMNHAEQQEFLRSITGIS